ncbi:MAG: hypothetical protein IJH70_11540 [Oscillospiraceae bacterium]|nr:hypothetical protein [Oscillospiraceae bacterium]
MIDTEMIKAAVKDAESTESKRAGTSEQQARSGSEWPYKPADYSDAGNADAFSRWVKGSLLHCPALGWLSWTGRNWAVSDPDAVSFSMQFAQLMLNDAIGNYSKVVREVAPGSTEEKAAKAYLTHAQKTRSKRSIDAFLSLSRPALYIELDSLDHDGLKLNTPGGLVDLRSGKIAPHSPDQLCMEITACTPSAHGASEWEDFLNDVTGNDGALKYFLQCVAGMAAVGKVLTETAVFLVGNGRNGKSTWLNAVAGVLGSYSRTMDIAVLTTAQQNRGAAFAELKGKRLICAGELEQGSRLSVSTLKQICSTDKITGERKYCAPAEFTPSHSLVLCSNYLPRVGADDRGCWRRIVVAPFNADFSGQKEIKNYASFLVERAGGAILQWVIDGAQAFLKSGGKLQIPDPVAEATEQYREAEDWLQGFLDECCITDKGASRIKARALYDAYKSYAGGLGDYCRRERDFAAAMESRGFRKLTIHGGRWYIGVRLSDYESSRAYSYTDA